MTQEEWADAPKGDRVVDGLLVAGLLVLFAERILGAFLPWRRALDIGGLCVVGVATTLIVRVARITGQSRRTVVRRAAPLLQGPSRPWVAICKSLWA